MIHAKVLQVARRDVSEKRSPKVRVADAKDCAFAAIDCQLDVSTSTSEKAAASCDNHQGILRHAHGHTHITGVNFDPSSFYSNIDLESSSAYHIGSGGSFYVKNHVTMAPKSVALIGNGASLVVTEEEYTIEEMVQVPDNDVKIL